MHRNVAARALAAAALAACIVSPAQGVGAAAREAPIVAKGAVVGLKGTPHIWIADEAGMLHWAGDTRALADRSVDWGNRTDITINELRSLKRGDPWLSAGLLKVGDPIYFVKWESGQTSPTLLHIQSIGDVELFGINATNYGAMVMDQAPWETKFGMPASTLTKGELEPAVKPLVLTGTTSTTTVEGTGWIRTGSGSSGTFSWSPTLDGLRLQNSSGSSSDYSGGAGSLNFNSNFRFDAAARIISGQAGLTLEFQQGTTVNGRVHFIVTPDAQELAIGGGPQVVPDLPPPALLPTPIPASQDFVLSAIRVGNQLAFLLNGTELSRLTIDQPFTGRAFVGVGKTPNAAMGVVDWRTATLVFQTQ